MRLLNILDFVYHVDKRAVLELIGAMSVEAHAELLAVSEPLLARLSELEVVDADDAVNMNVLTFIIEGIKQVYELDGRGESEESGSGESSPS